MVWGLEDMALARQISEAGHRIGYVADASVFPDIVSGNTNAASIMVGEKVSDSLLGKDPLPKANDRPWIHPGWATAQR